MKTLYKIFGVITNIVTWLAAGVVIIVICALLVPRIFGIEPRIVLSGSMEPVIHTGSLVYIGEMDREPEVGDIVAYNAGGGVAVVHRVVGYGDTGYITKGDANDVEDMNEVMSSQIMGGYVFTIPQAGYLLAAIWNHTVSIGPVRVPAAVFIGVGIILLLNMFQYVIGLIAFDNEE